MIELDFIRNIEKMKIEEIEWIVKTESAMFFLSNSIRPGPRIEFAQYNSNNFGNLNFQKSYFRIFKVHFSILKTPGVNSVGLWIYFYAERICIITDHLWAYSQMPTT